MNAKFAKRINVRLYDSPMKQRGRVCRNAIGDYSELIGARGKGRQQGSPSGEGGCPANRGLLGSCSYG